MKILEQCRNTDTLLVVDECFLDFVKEPEKYTLKEYLKQYPNLFLLKAFTKRYAMAGVRLGYGLSGNEDFLEKWSRCTALEPLCYGRRRELRHERGSVCGGGTTACFSQAEIHEAGIQKSWLCGISVLGQLYFFEGPRICTATGWHPLNHRIWR